MEASHGGRRTPRSIGPEVTDGGWRGRGRARPRSVRPSSSCHRARRRLRPCDRRWPASRAAVLGPEEVELQPQCLPQRRVEHRIGAIVEGQVGHRVGGLGGDVEGGSEVRLAPPRAGRAPWPRAPRVRRTGPRRGARGRSPSPEAPPARRFAAIGTDRARSVKRPKVRPAVIRLVPRRATHRCWAAWVRRSSPRRSGSTARPIAAPVDEVADHVVGRIADVAGEAERLREAHRASSGAWWYDAFGAVFEGERLGHASMHLDARRASRTSCACSRPGR